MGSQRPLDYAVLENWRPGSWPESKNQYAATTRDQTFWRI